MAEQQDFDDGLDDLVADRNLRARLRQLIMSHKNSSDLLDVSSLADLEERVDRMLVVSENLSEMDEGDSDVRKLEMQDDEEEERQSYPRSRSKEIPLRRQIESSLELINHTFNNIFQVLLVLIQSGTVDSQVRIAPDEVEKATKRSKDFEARLGRLCFELKQKAFNATMSIHRLDIHPMDSKLQSQADLKLNQALRSASSLLKAYHHHLPLSAGRVYPYPLLDKAIESLTAVATAAASLGYNASVFTDDIGRLRNAAERKWEELQEAAPKKETTTPKVAACKPNKAELNVINNLAREKFGVASLSPKKTNIKRQQFLQSQIKAAKQGSVKKQQKVIVPRGNRLLEDRARVARMKRGTATAEPPPSSPKKQGTAHFSMAAPLRAVTTVADDHFANIRSSSRASIPRTPMSSRRGHRAFDLDDDELQHIMKHRRQQHQTKPQFAFRLGEARLDGRVGMSLVGLLADKIVGEAVRDVCKEMASKDVVEKIFQSEFKDLNC